MFCVTGISKGNVNEVETKGMIWPEEANLRDSNTKFLNPQDAKISTDFLESIILNISFNKV